MTAGPDTLSFSQGGNVPQRPEYSDPAFTDLMSRLRANRQGIPTEPNTSTVPAYEATESSVYSADTAVTDTLQHGGLTIVVNPTQTAPTIAAAGGNSQPPTDTVRYRRDRYRGPGHTGLVVKSVAALAAAGTLLYFGNEIVHGIESVWHDITQAFQGQTDIKREAEAALHHIRIPDSTLAVTGDGSATATMSLSFKCPPATLGMCNIMFPGTSNSIVPYIDSKVDVTAEDQVIMQEEAWDLSTEVDKNGTPHTVVAVNADYVYAQLANEENTPTTDNHFTQRVANLFGLKTGNDQVTKVNEDTAHNVLQQACAEPLYEALPAGIARTAQFWDQETAKKLLSTGDTTGANRLQQMAGSTVIIKFVGSEMNLNGKQVVTNGVIKESGLRVDTAATKNCKLDAQAQADLQATKNQDHRTFEITQMLPLSTKPDTRDHSDSTAHPFVTGQGN